MKVKKGDTVKVIIGKDSGKQGKVIKVKPSDMMVVVDGVNFFKKHIKGDGKDKEASIIDVIKPLPVANVRVICSKCSKPVRVGYKFVGNRKERVCKKCGKFLDISVKAEVTKTKSDTKKVKKKVKKAKKTVKKVKKSTSKK